MVPMLCFWLGHLERSLGETLSTLYSGAVYAKAPPWAEELHGSPGETSSRPEDGNVKTVEGGIPNSKGYYVPFMPWVLSIPQKVKVFA